jgi:hypothetical protein
MQRTPLKSSDFLSLSGQVAEGKVTDDGANDVKVELKLRLEIKNMGSKPALIFRREPVVLERKIFTASSDSEAEKNKYLYRLQTIPSIARNQEWEQIQRRINKASPPPDLIRELAPNENWALELTTWFYISKSANLDRDSKPWSSIRQASPVLLQLTLAMWSADIEANVDRGALKFSKMLQRRWREQGNLQLDSLVSEKMILDFSSLTSSR